MIGGMVGNFPERLVDAGLYGGLLLYFFRSLHRAIIRLEHSHHQLIAQQVRLYEHCRHEIEAHGGTLENFSQPDSERRHE